MNEALWLINRIEGLVDEKNTKLVSEWAEENRILSNDVSAMAGPWKNYVTPYLVEIMNCFSETSNVQKVAVQKASQIGFALSIDTPIPTIDGWKLMGEIKNGDKLFDEKGNPCNVVFCTKKMRGHKCYEIKLYYNSSIFYDINNLLPVWD